MSTETANQISKMGIFLCNNFCESNIIATLPTNENHANFPGLSHFGDLSVCSLSFFESHSVGIINVFIGQT